MSKDELDLAVINGTVVLGGGKYRIGVGVKNGKVAVLAPEEMMPKAKEIRGYLEPLVTLAKVNNLSNQRLAYKRLQNREAVARLFNELGPSVPLVSISRINLSKSVLCSTLAFSTK